MPLNASSRMTTSGLRIMARRKRATRCAEKDNSPNWVRFAHSRFPLPWNRVSFVNVWLSSCLNHSKQASTLWRAFSSNAGTMIGVSAQADSRVRRKDIIFGNSEWISGEAWPIRDWMSKIEMPGVPGEGRRGRPKIFTGAE